KSTTRDLCAWYGPRVAKCHGAKVPRCQGAKVPRCQSAGTRGALSHPAPWHRCTWHRRNWHPGTLAPWHLGTVAPWHRGTESASVNRPGLGDVQPFEKGDCVAIRHAGDEVARRRIEPFGVDRSLLEELGGLFPHFLPEAGKHVGRFPELRRRER